MLPDWKDRPITVASLLNPAFCGELIRIATHQYNLILKKKLHFQLSFLILPLLLHKEIRETLPLKSSKNFIAWVEEHQEIKMLLPNLIKTMVPYTKEAIMFLMLYDIIKINETGELETTIGNFQKMKVEGEVSECYKKAELVGKWLANAGESEFIFINLGIKP